MARNTDKRPCSHPGCRNYAMRGADTCRSHAPTPPNPNGADPGNQNARRTGVYAQFLTADDLAALATVAADDNLDDEIAFTRVVIRRLASLINDATDPDAAISLAGALFSGTGRVAALLKTKRAISGQAADGIAGAIAQALNELSTEWGVEL